MPRKWGPKTARTCSRLGYQMGLAALAVQLVQGARLAQQSLEGQGDRAVQLVQRAQPAQRGLEGQGDREVRVSARE